MALKYIVPSVNNNQIINYNVSSKSESVAKQRVDYGGATPNLHTHCLVQGKTNYLAVGLSSNLIK